MVKVKSSTKPKGQAAQYLTRTRAIRKLQLSLPTFRRLCILKGIYPRYPSSIKKIQSASGKNGAHRGQTFYYTKDIQYLMHDPLVRTMRQLKVYKRKLKKLAGREEWERIEHLEKPVVQLSHVLKERYVCHEKIVCVCVIRKGPAYHPHFLFSVVRCKWRRPRLKFFVFTNPPTF